MVEVESWVVGREAIDFFLREEIIVWTTIVRTAILLVMTPTTPAQKLRFDSREQEAYLALWRTYDRLRLLEDELFAQYDITAQQYNLLRLLKAAHPTSVPTLTLASRLVSRAPDITRMLDRLKDREYIERERSEEDRRAVLVTITDKGIALLDEIAEPLEGCHEKQLGHLSASDLKTLVSLLKKVRSPHEDEESPWK